MDHGRILVTGANGFVGSALVAQLRRDGHRVRGSVRRLGTADQARLTLVANEQSADTGPLALVASGDLDSETDWRPALDGITTVVHCAARVHLMRDAAKDPLASYRATNTAATLSLARQAATAGVRRLVFLSTVKVLGEATRPGSPFTSASPLAPTDPYAVSKAEAETGLWRLARETGLEVVVVRPPLVYGPGVRANFLRLLQWMDRGVPLPLAGIDNRRSMVALDNLVDLLARCCTAPGAAGQSLLVSDDNDLSTPALLVAMAAALGRPARLFPMPAPLFALATRLGAGRALARLTGTLQVDIGESRRLLDWQPPSTVAAALAATAAWYRQQGREERLQ